MNWAAILDGAKTVAAHPVTKGGSLAVLISGGLYAAQFAGIAVPSIAFSAGPIAGYILYKLLPKKIEDDIDNVAKEVTDVVTEIPQTYAAPTDFPNACPQDTGKTTPNNLS